MNRQPTTAVPDCPRLIPIQRGDTVYHTLSDREFRCQDAKQERWMNMNPCYRLLFKRRRIALPIDKNTPTS